MDDSVSYNGDRGIHTVQVSENVNVSTSLDGESVFGRVQTTGGPKSIFEIVEGLMGSIDPLREINEMATAHGKARIRLELPRQNQDWSFTLKGGLGEVTIETTLSTGMEENLADAINAKSDQTGVIAEFDSDTGSIFLTEQGTDLIVIEDIEIEGEGIASEAGFYNMAVMSLDENGAEIGKERFLTDEDQLLGQGIRNVLDSIDHLGLQQAKLGAQASKAEIQLDVLQSRKLAVTRDISAMGDADLAKLVTELQSQLTNRDAAQQAFAKIGQQSLFDYIR